MIEIQVRILIVLGDIANEFFQGSVLIIVLGDERQGRSFFIVLYVVVELISSNVALQIGVQIGVGELVFGDTLHIRVIGQGRGAVFVDGLHHLGFGLGLRAGRTAATAAGGQEQKGQYTGQKQGSQLSQFCHVGRLQSFLCWGVQLFFLMKNRPLRPSGQGVLLPSFYRRRAGAVKPENYTNSARENCENKP